MNRKNYEIHLKYIFRKGYLQKPRRISRIYISWAYAPTEVSISVSNDNHNWETALNWKNTKNSWAYNRFRGFFWWWRNYYRYFFY